MGSFGKAVASKDDGKTWEPLALPTEVEDKHLNRIASSAEGKDWLIVGERGLVLRSDDSGTTWHAEPTFYNGSFYNAMSLANGGWLIYGMRGNVFMKADAHAEWTKSSVPAPISFFGHARQSDGTIVLVGQGSMLGLSRDNGKTFTLRKAKGRATLTDVVLLDKNQGWIASDAGLQPLPDLSSTDTPARQGTQQ
ncbi:Ycf48-like protein [bioreactor metagenome]|uniref:Ycf48-like protein n=1 Tax=bioreactor metagenome TaxID=1076179 RepID=A0A645DKS0_9ZZZZ